MWSKRQKKAEEQLRSTLGSVQEHLNNIKPPKYSIGISYKDGSVDTVYGVYHVELRERFVVWSKDVTRHEQSIVNLDVIHDIDINRI